MSHRRRTVDLGHINAEDPGHLICKEVFNDRDLRLSGALRTWDATEPPLRVFPCSRKSGL